MFTAKVYKVMVGSLSGTMEEVFAAKETIRKWNVENAESTGKLYMPIDWSANSNGVQDVDVVIGIVGNWVENTGVIEDRINKLMHVMLLFNTYHDPYNSICSEQDGVREFKRLMQDHCFCAEYGSLAELNELLNAELRTI